MNSPIVEIPATQWQLPETNSSWISGLEQGKVLYIPNLPFISHQSISTIQVLVRWRI